MIFSLLSIDNDTGLGDNEVDANTTFRNLITLHIRVTLLSDVFATAGYAHGRGAIHLLQTLMNNMSTQVFTDLGSLHRTTIWENLSLKTALAEMGIEVAQTPLPSPMTGSPEQPAVPLPDSDGANVPNGDGDPQADTPSVEDSPSKESPKPQGPREYNAAALKHWTHNLPGSLTPFFTGTVVLLAWSIILTLSSSDGEDVPSPPQS